MEISHKKKKPRLILPFVFSLLAPELCQTVVLYPSWCVFITNTKLTPNPLFDIIPVGSVFWVHTLRVDNRKYNIRFLSVCVFISLILRSPWKHSDDPVFGYIKIYYNCDLILKFSGLFYKSGQNESWLHAHCYNLIKMRKNVLRKFHDWLDPNGLWYA